MKTLQWPMRLAVSCVPIAFVLLSQNLLATPCLRLSALRGFAGATVEIPLTFRYASNDVRNVVGLQADVLFDSALATGGGPVRGDLLTSQVFDTHPVGPGWNRLLLYSENYQPLSTNGTLAQFTLTVLPGVLQNV